MDNLINALESGPEFFFRDWPNAAVPQVSAGAYTIWRTETLLYAGMSGRTLTEEQVLVHREANARSKGLYSRLNSHASGRRSGDQFCVYVANRLVLPTLTTEQIQAIAASTLSLDLLVRHFIHQHLSYRFVEAPDGVRARSLEAAVRSGALRAGKPLLNSAPSSAQPADA